MVGLDAVVRVLLGVMDDVEQQFLDHPEQWSGQIGSDLAGPAVSTQRGLEEPPCRRSVTSLGDVDVDYLAVLVNRAVHVTPDTGDLDVGLVNEPTVPDVMATGPGCVDQQRCEALDPSVDRDVINLDATLGEQFLDVAV